MSQLTKQLAVLFGPYDCLPTRTWAGKLNQEDLLRAVLN